MSQLSCGFAFPEAGVQRRGGYGFIAAAGGQANDLSLGAHSMPSPFPGMDPYIERPVIWPDFHNHLITVVKAALQPLLRPRYVALSEDRLFVVESDRPIRPDLALVRTSSPQPMAGAAIALM